MPDLETLGKSPISPEKPTGESIRYDADFDLIRAEIEKIDSVEQEDPNWRKVGDLCRGILETKSKDLLIATYFAGALFKNNSYDGLKDGLVILNDLISNYWEDMFPELKRKRGRIGAIEWLVERLPPWVDAAAAPRASDREALEKASEAFSSLFDVVREKLDTDAPAMGDLRRAIQKQVAALPKERTEEDEKPAAAPGAPPAPAEIETPEDALKAVRDAGSTLRRAATVLRQADPKDPLPYQLVRLSAWAEIKIVPPNQGGATQIPAPQSHILEAAANLTGASDWPALLELGEVQATEMPLWLDASRHSATALAGLGPGHETARETVCAELRTFLGRLPELTELQFVDGSPLADDQTKLWIEAEVLAGPGGANGSAGGGGGEEDPLAVASRDARKLLAKGKSSEAMVLLKEGMAGARSLRDRFRWKLAMATACHDAGQVELAVYQLDSLDRESEQFHLDEWEPELSVEVVGLLYKSRKKMLKGLKTPPPDAVEAASRAYARLCRIDPVAAMELK